MKSYECREGAPFTRLVHMDAYRIEEPSELRALRLSEIMTTPRVLLCIEWAERIMEVLPADTVFVTILTEGETKRIITMREGT